MGLLVEMVDEGDGVVCVMKMMMKVMLLVGEMEMEMIRAIFTMLEP